VNLPKKDGFEVLAEIRASESLRSIPVIIFTSASLATERKKALTLRAQEYISKPGTLDGLINCTLTFPAEANQPTRWIQEARYPSAQEASVEQSNGRFGRLGGEWVPSSLPL
jgi:CheY-like chemotaxis protein